MTCLPGRRDGLPEEHAHHVLERNRDTVVPLARRTMISEETGRTPIQSGTGARKMALVVGPDELEVAMVGTHSLDAARPVDDLTRGERDDDAMHGVFACAGICTGHKESKRSAYGGKAPVGKASHTRIVPVPRETSIISLYLDGQASLSFTRPSPEIVSGVLPPIGGDS